MSFHPHLRIVLLVIGIGSGPAGPAQLTYQLDNTLLEINMVLDSSRVNIPWEILWGPDGRLWMTDGPLISRWDPLSDEVDTLLVRPYGNGLGMALHPEFPFTPWVYAVFDTSIYYGGGQLCEVFRFEYDVLNDELINDTVLFSYPHAGEHAGGRLHFDGSGNILLTTADYWLQDDTLGHLMGKVLRFTAEGGVPADNPTPDRTWTRGHRNPQGLATLPDGGIVVSEHGMGGNNEINLILPDRNYGWAVFDGNDCTFIYPDSCTSPTYVVEAPLITFMEPPAGTEYYAHDAIPEFTNKLLTGILWWTGLKVFTFNSELDAIVEDEYLNEGAWTAMARIRDLAIHSDGSVYMITNDRQNPRIRRMRAAIPTAIDAPDGSSPSAWPNPTKGLIHLVGAEPPVQLLDMQGRSWDVPALNLSDRVLIDLSNLGNGTYIVIDTSGRVDRLVKQ